MQVLELKVDVQFKALPGDNVTLVTGHTGKVTQVFVTLAMNPDYTYHYSPEYEVYLDDPRGFTRVKDDEIEPRTPGQLELGLEYDDE